MQLLFNTFTTIIDPLQNSGNFLFKNRLCDVGFVRTLVVDFKSDTNAIFFVHSLCHFGSIIDYFKKKKM